jgi:hypothetical protein
MNRPPPRRSAQVQPEKPAPPAPPPAEGPPPGEGPPPAAAPRLHWGWRLALFLWVTSFLFLMLYDVLAFAFRVFRRLF